MNQDAPRSDWKTHLYYAAVLGVYAALIATIRRLAPVEHAAFIKWASPENGFCETLNLLFVAMNFFLAIHLLIKFRQRKTRVRRILWLLYFFVWLGEESQWGQTIFHFATPAWWQGMSGKNVFDLHTVVNYGCLLSVVMTIATALAFLTGFVRAWRGDKLSRLFSLCPLLVVVSGAFFPDRDYLWQLFISFVLAAYFALEAWQRKPQPDLAESAP